jgi:predicted nucleotidyltransferase
MTAVYPWKTLLARRVATPKQLRRVRKELLDILKKLHERGWIKSACIYGSGARRDFSVGSDLDVLIISDPSKEEAVQRYARRLNAIAYEENSVHTSIIHFNSEEARSGQHSISPSIFQHIMHTISPATLIGTSPAKLVRFNRTAVPYAQSSLANVRVMDARTEQIRENVLRRQKGSGYFFYLSRVIGQPIHSARNAIEAVNPKAIYGQQRPDNPEQIVHQYEKLFSAQYPQAVQALKRILFARQEYKKALAHAIKAIQSNDATRIQNAKKAYDRAVHQIGTVTKDRLIVLKTNARIATQRLRKPLAKALASKKSKTRTSNRKR